MFAFALIFLFFLIVSKKRRRKPRIKYVKPKKARIVGITKEINNKKVVIRKELTKRPIIKRMMDDKKIKIKR